MWSLRPPHIPSQSNPAVDDYLDCIMGCSPSKVLAAPALAVVQTSKFTNVSEEAAAEKLDWLLGLTIAGSATSKKSALLALDTWFLKRCPRSISKRVDLATSVAHDGTLEKGLESTLAASISDKACLESLTAALDTLHLRWMPKQCLGMAGLYHKVGEHKPWRFAFEQGCRMYDVALPPTAEIMAIFESMGMADEFKQPSSAFAEFAGCDTSDLCLAINAMAIVQADKTETVGPHMIREGFERLRKEMQPYEEEFGLPLADILILQPCCAFSFPDFKGHGCFSDWWKEAEKLVDEGVVRSLGLDKATIHQIEATLEFARHRPVMATFESSILAPMPEMVAFCKENRIAPRAIVALCKGDCLGSECLQRADMTPAQAALKWHIQQGVTPCFGNDTLDHITENMKAQTPQIMELPPVVAPIPARNLLKLYPMMAMNMPDMICKDGTREDKGTLHKDADGRYWISSAREAGDKWADQLMKMGDGEASLIREIESAIGGIKRDMRSGHERRMSIAHAIGGLGTPEKSQAEKMEATAQVLQAAKAEAEAKGMHFDPERDVGLDAFHSITGDSSAKGLVEMVVVPLTTFKRHGQIPRRSFRNREQHHVPVTSLGPAAKVLFFSQRWLTPSPRSKASPDDAPGGTKYKQLMAACEAYMTEQGVSEADLYIWLDYSSVDQDDDTLLVKGVNSLALYVCSSDAFISIEHADYFDRGWCLMECMFADASKTPRYIYTKDSTLKVLNVDMKLQNKTPIEGSFTVESDRAIMKVLSLVANSITTKIERGANFSVLGRSSKEGLEASTTAGSDKDEQPPPSDNEAPLPAAPES